MPPPPPIYLKNKFKKSLYGGLLLPFHHVGWGPFNYVFLLMGAVFHTVGAFLLCLSPYEGSRPFLSSRGAVFRPAPHHPPTKSSAVAQVQFTFIHRTMLSQIRLGVLCFPVTIWMVQRTDQLSHSRAIRKWSYNNYKFTNIMYFNRELLLMFSK